MTSWRNTTAAAVVAAAALFGAARAEAAIGWEITYQGELKDGGTPVNGTADLSFKLFTAGNVQVGPTVVKDDVVVTNGVFTTQVDFTNGGVVPGIFDGNERFIEVTVNGTTLAPKQRLAPAPHAAVSSLLVMPYAERTVAPGSAFYLQNDSQTPGTIAIHAEMSSADTGGVAIYGNASSTTSLNTAGVLGRSAAGNGYGVIGDATSLVGNVVGVYGSVASPSATGVVGIANSLTGGTKGVWGKVLSPTGHGGYFEGLGYFSNRVGIANTSPSYALDVTAPADERLVIRGVSGSSSGTYLTLDNTFGSGQPWNVVSTTTGMLNVGTTLEPTRLSVSDNLVGIGRSTTIGAADFVVESDATGAGYGGMYLNTPSATGKPFYGYATGGDAQSWSYYDGITASWRLFHAGADRISVDGTGEVGIGTTSPAFLLHVDGSAGKPGGGSWSVASDARLKKNVEPLGGALDRLLSLRGVTYEYIDAAKCNELPGRQIGMIAQEVERVFPDWVETANDGYKRLAFRGFEALTVEALRELAAQKDAQIAALEARLSERDARLATLEAHAAGSDAQLAAFAGRVVALEVMVKTLAAHAHGDGGVTSAAAWTPAEQPVN